MSWKTKRLDDLCEEITVGFVGTMAEHYVDADSGILFLRSQNIYPYKLNLEPSQLKYISTEFHDKLRKSSLKEGDIVIIRTGYPGTACVIPANTGELNCADLVIARPKKREIPKFICYYINSPFAKATISGSLVGSAQKHFNVGVAKRLEVPYPPLPVQQKIASILSAYDDLIENNLKRIKLLEEVAQSIYKEWFVQFRFPGYENTELKDGLPQGWEKKSLGEVGEVTSSKRIFLSDYVDSGIPFYRGKEIIQKSKNETTNEEYFITREKFNEIKTKFGSPKPGDFLITAVGTLGFSYLVSEDDGDFYFKDGNLIWIREISDKPLIPYLLLFLKSQAFNDIVHSISIGSSQKALTIVSLKKVKINSPEKGILLRFGQIINPVFNQIGILAKQTQKLQEARDILLPRLMNRTIDVFSPVEA